MGFFLAHNQVYRLLFLESFDIKMNENIVLLLIHT